MKDDSKLHKVLSRTITTESGCMEWCGCKDSCGYGVIYYTRKTFRVHRLVWELINGKLDLGIQVLHKCDNPPCINPKHLFTGTQLDNIMDMMSKGRQSKGSNIPHCKVFGERKDQMLQMIKDGILYKFISEEFGLSIPRISIIATQNGLNRI